MDMAGEQVRFLKGRSW